MEIFERSATFNGDYLRFYEPIFTPERNRADVDEITTILDLRPGSKILDAPCGHGRIANLLAGDGMEVTGVDATPIFLDRGRSDAAVLGVDVDYVEGDLRALTVDGPFDAVVCWFTSFGYFDDPDNQLVLQEFARVLHPGGRLLIETMHHDGFVRAFTAAPAAIVTERGDDVMIDTTTFDPVLGRIETDRIVRGQEYVRRSHHSVRLPTVPELDVWLASAGYSERRYTERGGRPLSFDSWRLVVVATV